MVSVMTEKSGVHEILYYPLNIGSINAETGA